jgi:thioesterase domain-containing protein
MVGMIDSPTVGARPSVKLLMSAVRIFRPFATSFVDRAMRRAWYICFQLDRWFSAPGARQGKVFSWRTDDRTESVKAVVNYSPTPLSVSVVYFAAEYTSAAWRHVSSAIETVEIDGNHAEAVRDRGNLAKIAASLLTRT